MAGSMQPHNWSEERQDLELIETVWIGTDRQLRVYNASHISETAVKTFRLMPGNRWERKGQTVYVGAVELPTFIRALLKAHEAHRGKR